MMPKFKYGDRVIILNSPFYDECVGTIRGLAPATNGQHLYRIYLSYGDVIVVKESELRKYQV